MCWIGKCDIKIAKRDFYVYKLGHISDKGFKSLYQDYTYEIKSINEEITLIPRKHPAFYPLCMIREGYHSYISISMPYSKLGLFSRKVYLGKNLGTLLLCNSYYIATFIIPKGSKYYENIYGEIVSSNIIYTGKYIKL